MTHCFSWMIMKGGIWKCCISFSSFNMWFSMYLNNLKFQPSPKRLSPIHTLWVSSWDQQHVHRLWLVDISGGSTVVRPYRVPAQSRTRLEISASSPQRLVPPDAAPEPKPWSHICIQTLWNERWIDKSFHWHDFYRHLLRSRPQSVLHSKPQNGAGIETKTHKMIWSHPVQFSLLEDSAIATNLGT